MTSSIYPLENRPKTLQQDIVQLLAELDYVQAIYSFGSLLGDGWDRWSDIDLIVITSCHAGFYSLKRTLHQAKPIRHHHPLLPAEPNGHHLLGVIFEDESVFHCVDLNLFTPDEVADRQALERFGAIQLVYKASELPVVVEACDEFSSQRLTAEEEQISVGIHFTKKHIKRVMRGQPAIDELRKWSDYLRETMRDYSENYQVVGGNIGWIAYRYLGIADDILNNQPDKGQTT